MFEKIRKLFTRKDKYASPYYGGTGALFNSSAVPLRKEQPVEEELPKSTPAPVRVYEVEKKGPTEPDWEQRRFELLKMFMAQERRSVVLGKIKATNKQIANTSRVLADTGIKELMNHPMDMSHDTGGEANDE